MVMDYYEGWLKSDDELTTMRSRDVAIKPSEGVPLGFIAHPNTKLRALLSREVSEQEVCAQV